MKKDLVIALCITGIGLAASYFGIGSAWIVVLVGAILTLQAS